MFTKLFMFAFVSALLLTAGCATTQTNGQTVPRIVCPPARDSVQKPSADRPYKWVIEQVVSIVPEVSLLRPVPAVLHEKCEMYSGAPVSQPYVKLLAIMYFHDAPQELAGDAFYSSVPIDHGCESDGQRAAEDLIRQIRMACSNR